MSSIQIDMEIIKRTMQYLTDSYSSKDTNKIKEAVKGLETLSADFVSHFQVILKILSLDEKDANSDLKKSAAVYLKNLTLSKIKQLSKEDIISIFQSIITVMLDPSTQSIKSNQAISNIINNLIYSILNLNTFFSEPALIKNILSFFTSTITKAPEAQYIIVAKSVLSLLSTVIGSKALNSENIKDTIQEILTSIDDIFSKVPLYIIPSQQILDSEFVLLLKGVFDAFLLLIKKTKQFTISEQILLMLFEKYGNYSYELISLSVNNVSQAQENIVYYTTNGTLNGKVNSMKAKAIQFITRIIEGSKEEINNNSLVLMTSNLIKMILASMNFAVKNQKLVAFNQEIDLNNIKGDSSEGIQNEYSLLIYSLLTFLSRALIREPIKKDFTSLIKNFLLNYLFPFIVPTQVDLNMMDLDGHDYYIFINDIVDKFKFKNFRTAASFLLIKLTKKYIDITSYIIYFSMQMLDILLVTEGNTDKINELSTNPDYRLFFEAKASSPSIFSFEPEYLIQFSLMILILLKEYIKNDTKMKLPLHKILLSHQNKLHSISSPLMKDKLCLVYDTIFALLFDDKSTENMQCISNEIDFLIQTIMTTNQHPGLAYQATATLLNIFDDEDFQFREISSKVINAKLEDLIVLIEETDNDNYFDFISTVVADIEIDNVSLIMKTLMKTIIRLKKEIISNNLQFIEKCFMILVGYLNGINAINLEKKESIEIVKQFQEMIIPIVTYIKNPKKINFEESILNLVKEFISATKQLSEVAFMVVPSIVSVIQKNEVFPEEAFTFLLEFMKYDQLTNGCKSTVQFLKDILQIIMFTNDNAYHDPISTKYSLLTTIKLLTLELQGVLTKDILASLIRNAADSLEEIEHTYYENEIEYNNMVSVAVMGTVLIYYPELGLQILEEEKLTSQFITMIRETMDYSPYYTELFRCTILGICSLLLNNTTLNVFINSGKITDFLKLFFLLVQKQKEEALKYMRDITKKEIDCNFVEGEDSDDDDDEAREIKKKLMENEEDFNDNKKELENCEFTFKGVDEFKQFSECLKSIETINPEISKQFLSSLTTKEATILQELIQLRKVIVRYNNKVFYVPRRQIKIRRTNQNN